MADGDSSDRLRSGIRFNYESSIKIPRSKNKTSRLDYKQYTTALSLLRAIFWISYMGFGASNCYKNGFRSSQCHKSPDVPKLWSKLPETLVLASKRLLQAQIKILDYKELLDRYNTKDVFIYLDPPYVPDKRKNYIYKNEFKLQDHEELLSLIIKHPAKIMISGYDSSLYNDALRNWKKASKKNQVEGGLIREEVIWMNYETEQTLFDI